MGTVSGTRVLLVDLDGTLYRSSKLFQDVRDRINGEVFRDPSFVTVGSGLLWGWGRAELTLTSFRVWLPLSSLRTIRLYDGSAGSSSRGDERCERQTLQAVRPDGRWIDGTFRPRGLRENVPSRWLEHPLAPLLPPFVRTRGAAVC